ncbi:hypothetical protein GGQ74_000590 [Desulfobaculum xiamenense]|uniref:Uncharacterized protein n=1 Tax=Desulfobaculum xiamenense TaxID=995050 RepID=A0A846QIP6_9BACT|nr:hypothetical protein [Desulfobaculum xiamenense]NJB66950.1 hypothetical protein [Desulfobaculum xiamenense]
MDDLFEVLTRSEEMAGKSAEFYARAAGACSDALGAAMLSMLRREKLLQMWRLRAVRLTVRHESWNAVKPPVEEGIPLRIVFRRLAVRHEPPRPPLERELDALGMALEMEQAIVGYHGGQFEDAGSDAERRFLEQLIAEGQEVILLITDLQYYFTDPHGWVMTADADGFLVD